MQWFLPFLTVIYLVHCKGADNAKCSNVTCSSHKNDLCIKINEGTDRDSLRLVSNCKLQQLLCLETVAKVLNWWNPRQAGGNRVVWTLRHWFLVALKNQMTADMKTSKNLTLTSCITTRFTANLIPVEECSKAQKKPNILRKKIKPRHPAQPRSESSDLSPKKRGRSKKHKRPSKIGRPKDFGRHGALHPRPTTRRPKATKRTRLELWGRPAGKGKRPHPTIFKRARLEDEPFINDRKPKSGNSSKPRSSTKPGHSKDGDFKKLGRASKLKLPQDFGRSGVPNATTKQKGLGLWGKPSGRGKRSRPTMRATLGDESSVLGVRPYSATRRHPRKLKFENSSKSGGRMNPGCSTDASFKKLGRPAMLEPLKMPKAPGVTRPHKYGNKLNLWGKTGGRGRRPKPTIFGRAGLDDESVIGSPRSGSTGLDPFKKDKGKPGRLPRVLERHATLEYRRGRRHGPPPKRPWPWCTLYSEPTRPTQGKLLHTNHPKEKTTRSTTCTWPKSNIKRLTNKYTLPTKTVKRLTNKYTSPTKTVTRPTYRCTLPTETVKRLTNKYTSPTKTVTRPTYRCTLPTETVKRLTNKYTSPTKTVTRPTYRCTLPTETVKRLTNIYTSPTVSITRPTYRCTSPTESITRPTNKYTSPTETNTDV